MDGQFAINAIHRIADEGDIDLRVDYERSGTLSLLPDVEGMHMLDASCGTDWYAEWCMKRGAVATVIDPIPHKTGYKRKRIQGNETIIQADLSQPLSMINNESYELIVSSLTLHYFKDWELLMNEFNRVLKDKGRLVFSVHHPFLDYFQYGSENYFSVEPLDVREESDGGKVGHRLYRRPLSEIIKPLYLNGFVIEKIIEPMPTELYRKPSSDSDDPFKNLPHLIFIKAQKSMTL